MDIHVVSLLEPTLTEDELGMLFTNLPAKSIVLLEDIDTAGLEKRPEAGEEDKLAAAGGDELNVATLTKAFKRANQQTEEERKRGISLSGLLNILDGVSSVEGRVLIMTTNHPEKLDEALIRPGRVDLQVAFTNATRSQIKELFERMYTDDLPGTHIVTSDSQTKNGYANGYANGKVSGGHESKQHNDKPKSQQQGAGLNPASHHHQNGAAVSPGNAIEVVTNAQLKEIAQEFASKIPDSVFTPAEIQGFLLKRKKEPLRARNEVEKWVEEALAAKESKKTKKTEELAKVTANGSA